MFPLPKRAGLRRGLLPVLLAVGGVYMIAPLSLAAEVAPWYAMAFGVVVTLGVPTIFGASAVRRWRESYWSEVNGRTLIFGTGSAGERPLSWLSTSGQRRNFRVPPVHFAPVETRCWQHFFLDTDGGGWRC